MNRVSNLVTNYAAFLVAGAAVALAWANADAESYRRLVDYPLWFNNWIGADTTGWLRSAGPAYGITELGDVSRVLSVRFLVNDMAMAFFFVLAAKEVWEALVLKNGSLRGRKAATPLFATAGGMLGAIGVYLGLAALLGSDVYDALARGWAVPSATDIALSYVVGRAVFGAGHPAVRFLLLLAVTDDILALVLLAAFHPSAELAPAWLLLSLLAALAAFVLFNWLPRQLDRGDQLRPNSTFVRKRLGVWPYLLAGAVSWYAVQQSGLHPALGLLPIVPAIPHADRAFGIFSEAEDYLHDVLNQAAHLLAYPVAGILFAFGLVNAGVAFPAAGGGTWAVLAGLVLGKCVGVALFGWIAAVPLRLGLPAGMRGTDLVVVGCAAGVGFTVPLLMVSAAFDPGPLQDAARMGVPLSLSAAILAMLAARLFGVEKQTR